MAGERRPVRRRVLLALAVLAAFGAGVGVSQAHERQVDAAQDRQQGGVVALGADLVAPDSSFNGESIVLVVRVTNRGPRSVELQQISIPGTGVSRTLKNERMAAGADTDVWVGGAVTCSDRGADPHLPMPLTATLRVRTEQGLRTIVQRVRQDQMGPFASAQELDAYCGVVPAEQAVEANVQAPRAAAQGIEVELDVANRSRGKRQVVGVELGGLPGVLLRDGHPVPLPLVLPPLPPDAAVLLGLDTLTVRVPYPADCAALESSADLVLLTQFANQPVVPIPVQGIPARQLCTDRH